MWNIDNHDRVLASKDIAIKSWEDQIKAIDDFKYQNQNIGPKSLDKLRESENQEQWLATAGTTTSYLDQWHATAGTTTSNLIKRLVDKKYELDQDVMDAAEILTVPVATIETKMNEQLLDDIKREKLLEATNEPTHTIDTLRKSLNVSKSEYIKAQRLMREGDTKKTNTKVIDKDNWKINKTTGQVIPFLEISESFLVI